MEVAGSTNTEGLAERVAQLEAENTDLRTRLEAARGRARHMLERVRFLRQQQEGGR
jgi:cell division protein FtsB